MSSDRRAVIKPEATARNIPADPFLCANCGTAYSGNFCPNCGQTTRTPLRHFGALAEDALDLFFNFDSRFVHTVPPLLLRPGFLSNEYFSGRRVRYIPPFRLMFLLSLLAFLLLHLAINAATSGPGNFEFRGGFSAAETPAEVQQQLDDALGGIATARLATGGVVGSEGFDKAEAKLRSEAAQRLRELATKGTPGTPASTQTAPIASPPAGAVPLPPVPARAGSTPSTAPSDSELQLDILPSRFAAALEQLKQRFKSATHDAQERQRMIAGFFRALPQSMLVLLPIFALLLKFTYLFKRRLYVEHLIVAMHSHAFIFLVLLLLSGVSLASSTWPALSAPLGLLTAVLWLWLPLYLLLMQKRVYRQGWFLTLLKYAFVGTCYVILVSFTLLAAAIISAMTT